MKYFFCPSGGDSWFISAQVLRDRYATVPGIWLGHSRLQKKALAEFPDTKVIDLNRLKAADYDFNSKMIDVSLMRFFQTKSYQAIKEVCLKMLDRRDSFNHISRLEREAMIWKVAVWGLGVISSEKLDFAIFYENPHSYERYLMYQICLFLNIPVVCWCIVGMDIPIMYMRELPSERIIPIQFLRSASRDLDLKIMNHIEQECSKYLEAVSSDGYEPKYMANNRLSSLSLPSWIDALILNVYRRSPRLMPALLGKRFEKRAKMVELMETYDRIASSICLVQDYVFFALQYEPERTTNPDAGLYNEQLIALLTLRSALPSNVTIVVKEHPSQFYSSQNGFAGRHPNFYVNLSLISGVTVAPKETSSIELIENAMFCATLTGSVGFEALLKGKKCLLFGMAWYSSFPGAIRWSPSTFSMDNLCEPVKPAAVVETFKSFYIKNGIPGVLNDSSEKLFFDTYFKKSIQLDNLTGRYIADAIYSYAHFHKPKL